MPWLRERWRRLRWLFTRGTLESGLSEEIRFHIERQTEKLVRAGMPADEARRQAGIRFGGVERVREHARDQFRSALIEDVVRDLRLGGRSLSRAPGFTCAAVLTLALGIGATTAMFSVVNGVLLRPLPYPEQDRLVELVHEAPGMGIDEVRASPAVYFGYRDHSRTFESVGLWDWDSSPVTVTGRGAPEAIPSLAVTHEVLAILGATPIVGRHFTQADDLPGSVPTAIISHGLWQRRFGGGDPSGQPLVVDGVSRQIIGVLPPAFRFFDYPADIFYPLQPIRSNAGFPAGDGRGIARLKPGVSLEEANADVARMLPLINEEFGGSGALFEQARFGPRLRWLKDIVVGDLADTLWLLMGTIGLLLAIACANVANLMLVRTQSRRRELAVRTALGAGRTAVARVVLAESVILGAAGSLAGLGLAHLGLPALLSIGAGDLPDVMTVTIDPTVLLVTAGTALLATLLFSLAPVLHFAAPRLPAADMVSGETRSSTDGRSGNRARHSLLVVQVALVLVLLVASGLMMRTFATLRRVDPGFRDQAQVQTFQLTIPAAAMTDASRTGALAEDILRMQHAIVDRLAAVAGVGSAAFSSSNDGLPLDGDGRTTALFVEGRSAAGPLTSLKEVQLVSPQFFETLRTPLLAGRTFDWNDVHHSRRVALVSENLARAEWGAPAAALGQRVGTGRTGPWSEVVGVVQDVHHDGLNLPAPETVIFPASARNGTASFVIRSERVGTAGFLDDLRAAVWSVNPDLSPANVQTLGDLYQRSMARTAMSLQLLAVTGTLALVLGLIGIYGTVSYAVAQRHREIGIRLALGAGHGAVRRMFVRQALAVTSVGIALGLGAAAGLTGLMGSQLFGVTPLDPLTHLVVSISVLAAAGLASDLSARRASAFDPVEILKGP